MIEEMSEADELRSRLGWVEHDLDHVTTERDKAQEKLDEIYALAFGALRSGENFRQTLVAIRIISRS